MEQHAIPRQITTFEFKLIGFMTLKQFIYLVVFIPLGYLAFRIFPIPILNILLGVLIGGVGLALAFVPINERPLDIWITNFIKRLTSPTQYFFLKNNNPLYFLNDLYFVSDPHRVVSHVESQEKLAAYLNSTRKTKEPETEKQNVQELLQTVTQKKYPSENGQQQAPQAVSPQLVTVAVPAQAASTFPVPSPKTPFFTGVVKNHKYIPIPGILIYVKDEGGKTLRLLKSNPNGVFATFNILPSKDYLFEFKDPRGTYVFDTMKLRVSEENPKPFEFYSKELL